MKNASTRLVYDYWNRKRGDRLAPQRADINPTDIRHALSDTFMLAADFINQLRFRLAGTRVCALFGREIKGEAFAELWNDESHKMIEKQITIVTNEATGLVAGVTAHTEDGLTADLELLLLPLAHVGHARTRALGVLAPLVPPYWLGATPVANLDLGTLRHLGPDAEGQPARRFISGLNGVRLKHGFVVYSGGRENPSGEAAG